MSTISRERISTNGLDSPGWELCLRFGVSGRGLEKSAVVLTSRFRGVDIGRESQRVAKCLFRRCARLRAYCLA